MTRKDYIGKVSVLSAQINGGLEFLISEARGLILDSPIGSVVKVIEGGFGGFLRGGEWEEEGKDCKYHFNNIMI